MPMMQMCKVHSPAIFIRFPLRSVLFVDFQAVSIFFYFLVVAKCAADVQPLPLDAGSCVEDVAGTVHPFCGKSVFHPYFVFDGQTSEDLYNAAESFAETMNLVIAPECQTRFVSLFTCFPAPIWHSTPPPPQWRFGLCVHGFTNRVRLFKFLARQQQFRR